MYANHISDLDQSESDALVLSNKRAFWIRKPVKIVMAVFLSAKGQCMCITFVEQRKKQQWCAACQQSRSKWFITSWHFSTLPFKQDTLLHHACKSYTCRNWHFTFTYRKQCIPGSIKLCPRLLLFCIILLLYIEGLAAN